ncbi:lytic transglycosylase domain-containing protein [Geminicoccaceae bacterium 1502E]|nr:lytic transglycosylase domain-containing protein [Geminicoccaceae bacterium 1502E]
MRFWPFLPVLLAILAAPLSAARSDARDRCLAAAAAAERSWGLPEGILRAIALTESGRWDAGRGQGYAWPWTVVSGSISVFHDSREAALRHVRELEAQGRRNIDVGCMQINLGYHPDAFARLEDAFDPATNVGYAARFLSELQAEAGAWETAVAYYHSRDPERGGAYRERVQRHWAGLGPAPAPAADPAPRESLDPAILQATNRAAVASTWQWLHGGPAPAAAPVLTAAGVPAASSAAGRAPPKIFAGVAQRLGAVPGIVVVAGPPRPVRPGLVR